MRVLDLCAGLGGWSRPARDRGHDVVTLDLDPRFGCDVVADVIEWEPDPGFIGTVDLLTASPPCDAFSVLNIGKNWTKPPGNEPKTEAARHALAMVEGVLRIIETVRPRWYVIENPRAKLRRVVEDRWPDLSATRRTVTYCQYGEPMMKPTDLWGRWPESLRLRPPCRTGDECHIRAPRGSTSGTQGFGAWKGENGYNRLDPNGTGRTGSRLDDLKKIARDYYGTSEPFMLAALRAAIPRDLALAFIRAAEADLAALGVPGPAQPVEFLDGPGQMRLFASGSGSA